MAASTRRDGHGRVLAPSRFNRRAEIVVESPTGERLSEERMAALGVDFDASARGPDTSQTQPSSSEAADYPIDRGGGWFELSDGERVRGEDDALAAEARLQAGEE